jgi:hypothetical protein
MSKEWRDAVKGLANFLDDGVEEEGIVLYDYVLEKRDE